MFLLWLFLNMLVSPHFVAKKAMQRQARGETKDVASCVDAAKVDEAVRNDTTVTACEDCGWLQHHGKTT